MNEYYNEIKNRIIDNEIYSKVKDYTKERNRVITYFEIGKILSEAGSKYGDKVIETYSKKLIVEVGKQYNKRTLYRMKKFYNMFKNENVTPLVTQLTWTHYVILMSIKDKNEIYYYIEVCKHQNLSKRELETRIKNKEYERLSKETKDKLINKEQIEISDFIKNPIIIRNKNNYEIISEKILQQLILNDIENFMNELGQSFCFIGSEYKIKIHNTYNYIDLLLYNIKFKCYVVIELKITELKKEHIGQIQIYMNYIDKNLKTINEEETIGIIIVKKDNKYILEYCSDKRVLSKEYILN